MCQSGLIQKIRSISLIVFYALLCIKLKKAIFTTSFRGALYAAEIIPLVPDTVNAGEGKSN